MLETRKSPLLGRHLELHRAWKFANLNNSKVCKANLYEGGFALIIIVIVGLIMSAGLMALATRSWLGLNSSMRQSQSREAREIAEAGVAKTLESLNREYPHLLIRDLSRWTTVDNSTPRCMSAKSSGSPPVSGTIGTNGRYTILAYTFNGSTFYGGRADLQVKGERLVNGTSPSASSIVRLTVDIKPKDCETPFNREPESSGFPGLLARSINLGGNDIFGDVSGNVVCTNCPIPAGKSFSTLTEAEKRQAIGANPNTSEIGGDIFLGPLDTIPVPTQPEGLEVIPAAINKQFIEANGSRRGGGSPSYEYIIGANRGNPMCDQVDGILHCVVSSISLSGNYKLIADTSGGPIRIYITGTTVSFTGGAALEHIPASANASALGLFGLPDNGTNQAQTVTIAGGANNTKVWINFPNGSVGINGGSRDSVSCTGTSDEEFCTGGDIVGAVWAKTWTGSNSNVGQIVVPPYMGRWIFNEYGPTYAIGVRGYVAVGVSKWGSWIFP